MEVNFKEPQVKLGRLSPEIREQFALSMSSCPTDRRRVYRFVVLPPPVNKRHRHQLSLALRGRLPVDATPSTPPDILRHRLLLRNPSNIYPCHLFWGQNWSRFSKRCKIRYSAAMYTQLTRLVIQAPVFVSSFLATYTGSILIAVNPFTKLPHLYNVYMMEQYKGAPFGELSPM
ncbi:unnamed protein product [Lactuca virosa]|uniref:Myosin motor domain-containing protein n=1 Tax=Lactuca virosa TaxID=75947 RepID=A0AAU9M3N4_9ASTR|nr:unnamed protein product [Lactuca virosa]